MADFEPAFEKMIKNEGGYILHQVSGDRGGQTYAGIARNFHPNWKGWSIIDSKDEDNPNLTTFVRSFYQEKFWDRIKGDKIKKQKIAESLFDFSVNTGVKAAAKLAQLVVDTTPDGIIGPKSLKKLNAIDDEVFSSNFALSKLARYAQICKRDPVQKKFLLGWVNRILGGLA